MNRIVIRKVISVFCLSLLPYSFVYSQRGADTSCRQNIENILKVRDLKIKYEAVESLYQVLGDLKNLTKNIIYKTPFIIDRGKQQWFQGN